MRIRFLGVGNSFTTKEYWQSNMLIEIDGKNILFDCGTDARFSLPELIPSINNGNIMEHIDGVYISHVHADHCGGLEWLGFCTYFSKSEKPYLLCHPDLKEELWENALKGGMAQIENATASLDTYFDVKCGTQFKIRGNSFRVVKSVHVESITDKMSYGLMITNDDKKAYITSDVIFDPSREEYDQADIIFHDCETATYKSNVHSHYDDLKTMDANIKSKMWLYHYNPGAEKDINAVADGFAGFVKKGQSFSI